MNNCKKNYKKFQAKYNQYSPGRMGALIFPQPFQFQIPSTLKTFTNLMGKT